MGASSVTRRDFLSSAFLGGMSLMMAPTVLRARTPSKPNFVFILIDDMGWTDLSCYGSTLYRTPNIDRLASRGMRFTDAYAACPVCSPTRASIMTGKYPARLHLTDWIPGLKPKPTEKIAAPDYLQELPLGETTIAEALKPLGYASASVGKWHLGAEPYYPEHQGFDLNIGGTHRGAPPDYFYPAWKGDISLPVWTGNVPVPGRDGDYLTDRLTDEAVKFIKDTAERPFFLYLSHYAVHTPIQAKPEKIDKYRAAVHPNATHTNAVYAAMIESVDESVGRVMKTLEECGIADRTVVFFMSDNGGLSTCEGENTPSTSNSPLRAGKGHVYEGGIREPMIVCWPGAVEPGSVCTEPVISVDFFPTIMDIAGRRPDQGSIVDGVSLVPLLKKTGGLNREAIFWHYPHYSPQWATPAGAIRCGDYKLIEFFEDGHLELYNLAGDIGERNNLLDYTFTAHESERFALRAKDLHDRLVRWRESVGARMPTPNPDYAPE